MSRESNISISKTIRQNKEIYRKYYEPYLKDVATSAINAKIAEYNRLYNIALTYIDNPAIVSIDDMYEYINTINNSREFNDFLGSNPLTINSIVYYLFAKYINNYRYNNTRDIKEIHDEFMKYCEKYNKNISDNITYAQYYDITISDNDKLLKIIEYINSDEFSDLFNIDELVNLPYIGIFRDINADTLKLCIDDINDTYLIITDSNADKKNAILKIYEKFSMIQENRVIEDDKRKNSADIKLFREKVIAPILFIYKTFYKNNAAYFNLLYYDIIYLIKQIRYNITDQHIIILNSIIYDITGSKLTSIDNTNPESMIKPLSDILIKYLSDNKNITDIHNGLNIDAYRLNIPSLLYHNILSHHGYSSEFILYIIDRYIYPTIYDQNNPHIIYSFLTNIDNKIYIKHIFDKNKRLFNFILLHYYYLIVVGYIYNLYMMQRGETPAYNIELILFELLDGILDVLYKIEYTEENINLYVKYQAENFYTYCIHKYFGPNPDQNIIDIIDTTYSGNIAYILSADEIELYKKYIITLNNIIDSEELYLQNFKIYMSKNNPILIEIIPAHNSDSSSSSDLPDLAQQSPNNNPVLVQNTPWYKNKYILIAIVTLAIIFGIVIIIYINR